MPAITTGSAKKSVSYHDFYLMKRKRKEDPQVNLWDFSRQSDDMMSEF